MECEGDGLVELGGLSRWSVLRVFSHLLGIEGKSGGDWRG